MLPGTVDANASGVEDGSFEGDLRLADGNGDGLSEGEIGEEGGGDLLSDGFNQITRGSFDDRANAFVGGAVVDGASKVVRLTGGVEVGREANVDDESLALGAFLGIDAVVGVKAKTFEEDLVRGCHGNKYTAEKANAKRRSCFRGSGRTRGGDIVGAGSHLLPLSPGQFYGGPLGAVMEAGQLSSSRV